MEGGSQLICILTEVYKPGLWIDSGFGGCPVYKPWTSGYRNSV